MVKEQREGNDETEGGWCWNRGRRAMREQREGDEGTEGGR